MAQNALHVRYGGKTQAQCVLSQSSYYSCNDPRLHFGLASYTAVDLEVHWPGGLIESFKHLPVSQLITLKQGVGRVPNRGWSKA
jgi:enediyne biosynthesis protein E4